MSPPALRPRALLLALAGAACATALLAAGRPAAAAEPPRGVTLVARVVTPTLALRAPRPEARPIARVLTRTRYTGVPMRLMVTGRRRDAAGRRWVRVQLPLRPNGTAGWVRAGAVRLQGTRVRVIVRLESRRLELRRGSRLLGSWPAGVGRPATPTPAGRYAVQDQVRTAASWRSVYGRHTLALTAYSPTLRTFMGREALIGIHGPGDGRPWRVGARSSNGCVILAEPALERVARHVSIGTPVIITRT